MTAQLPYGEAWLLEALAFSPCALWRLSYNERDMRDWLNRGYHGLGPQELRQTLLRMFQAGDIEARPRDDVARFTPTETQLEEALCRRDKTTICRCTARGGARWEALAKPTWSRYFESFYEDDDTLEITAGSRERLLELVANSQTILSVTVDKSKLDIECIQPWQPVRCRWKSLDVGYRSLVHYSDFPKYRRSDDGSMVREPADDSQDPWSQARYIHWATSICGEDPV